MSSRARECRTAASGAGATIRTGNSAVIPQLRPRVQFQSKWQVSRQLDSFRSPVVTHVSCLQAAPPSVGDSTPLDSWETRRPPVVSHLPPSWASAAPIRSLLGARTRVRDWGECFSAGATIRTARSATERKHNRTPRLGFSRAPAALMSPAWMTSPSEGGTCAFAADYSSSAGDGMLSIRSVMEAGLIDPSQRPFRETTRVCPTQRAWEPRALSPTVEGSVAGDFPALERRWTKRRLWSAACRR